MQFSEHIVVNGQFTKGVNIELHIDHTHGHQVTKMESNYIQLPDEDDEYY